MFIATCRRRSPSTVYSRSISSRTRSTSSSVSSCTRRSSRDADLAADLMRLGAADAMDVGEPDRDPLLIRDIDASDPRHLRFSFKDREMRVGSHFRKGEDYTDRRTLPSIPCERAAEPGCVRRITASISPRHLVDLGHAVDPAQNAAFAVIRQDRRGLIAIDLRTASSTASGRSSARRTKSVLPQTSQTPSRSRPVVAVVIAGAAVARR